MRHTVTNNPGTFRHPDALCLNSVDPDMWHEDNEDARASAKAVCQRCPAREACLDFAMRTRQSWGVWGGLDVTERDALRRTMSRQSRHTEDA